MRREAETGRDLDRAVFNAALAASSDPHDARRVDLEGFDRRLAAAGISAQHRAWAVESVAQALAEDA